MVAVTGAVERFTAAKEAISPVPLAGRLMEGKAFVQWKMVPGTAPENVTGTVVLPLQTAWPETGFTSGIGLTITVFVVVVVAVQPVAGSV